jgi:protein-disulfide isomerase-like protein with CxxC motif
MSRNLLKTEFDEASMLRKLKALGKTYGDTQDQMIKRWGVQTCRDLARQTFPRALGSKDAGDKVGASASAKKAMFKDANKVLLTHKGAAKASKKGNSLVVQMNGKTRYVSRKDYLNSPEEVNRWINQNRVRKNKRTIKLPYSGRKICHEKTLRTVITTKYKRYSGMAKDGWLDAADDIGRGQRGKNQVKIGASFLKWSRKPSKYGKSRQKRGLVNSFGILENLVSHSVSSYVLSESNKRRAIKSGLDNTIKWYRKTIRAENRKKK